VVSVERVEVVIVGAGFSGLGMAIALRQAGLDDFVVLEQADRLGGTWRDNTYPGCGCDVQSHLYSYSFELNPDWSRRYAEHAEIQRYLEHCATRHRLHARIRLNTEMTSAAFDERTGRWTVRTPTGTIDAGALVLGIGPLHRPHVPDLPGRERFTGAVFHSARWDHDVDLTGKRVAVIGTGASAIQFVPRIAPMVDRLWLFQRTAPWVIGKPDRPFSRLERATFRRFPSLMRAYRQSIYWRRELQALGFTRRHGLRVVEWTAKRAMRRAIDDPELRRKLTPNYRAGCKRILLSEDFYPALARPQVELVTTGLAELRERSIVTGDGRELPVDAVILATGFDVIDGFTRLSITGAGGQCLATTWADGVEAYLGTAVAGFPNMFLLLGPNTGLGHSSVVYMAEQQFRYVLRCLLLLRRSGARCLMVRQDAQDEFNREIQRRLRASVWNTGGCRSWYLDPDGVNRVLWPGFGWRFAQRTRAPDPTHFSLTGTRADHRLAG
jgi:cation diffusion facilitator CzcD-associated flavoprotein CzcO